MKGVVSSNPKRSIFQYTTLVQPSPIQSGSISGHYMSIS